MNKTIYNLLIIATLAGLVTAGLLIDKEEKVGGDLSIIEDSLLATKEIVPVSEKVYVDSVQDSLVASLESTKINDAYKSVAASTTKEGLTYSIQGYVSPDKSDGGKLKSGYQILYIDTNGNRMSTGTGPLASELSHDWMASSTR